MPDLLTTALAEPDRACVRALAAANGFEPDLQLRKLIRDRAKIVDGRFTVLKLHPHKPEPDQLAALTETIAGLDALVELDVRVAGPPIDLSRLTRLKKAHLQGGLTELDLSAQARLTQLSLTLPDLPALDLSPCASLEELSISQYGDGAMERLDLSSNLALRTLRLRGLAKLTGLWLPQRAALRRLEIYSERLARLDLSRQPALEHLEVSQLAVVSLALGGAPGLKELKARCMAGLVSIDLRGCDALHELTLEDLANLRTLDLSECAGLETVEIVSCRRVNELQATATVAEMSSMRKRRRYTQIVEPPAAPAPEGEEAAAAVDPADELADLLASGRWSQLLRWLDDRPDDQVAAHIEQIRAFERAGGETGSTRADLDKTKAPLTRWLKRAAKRSEPRAALITGIYAYRAKRPLPSTLLRSTSLPPLESVSISNSELGDSEAIGLAEAPWAQSLESLDLGWNKIGPRGAAALGALVDGNEGLRSLTLTSNPIGSSFATLAALGPGPKSASFYSVGLDGAGLAAAADGWAWQRLNNLYLSGNAIGDAGLRALAGLEALDGLRSLLVSIKGATADGVRALLAAPFTSGLRSLTLGDGEFRAPEFSEIVDVLVASDALDGLNRLDLGLYSHSKISDRDREALEDRFLTRLYS